MDLNEIRSQIPALSAMTYLNTASTGLPARPVTDSMVKMIDAWSREGENDEEWAADIERLRAAYGGFVGAGPREIAIVTNASSGLKALASSLDLGKRKKVVTTAINFPSNVLLWQAMRAAGLVDEVVVLRHDGRTTPLELWEKAVDEQTAVVAMDYVSWVSGFRENVREVAELAHRKGALALVDAYHAVGVFPVDVKRDGVDALVGGFAKWLSGPHGVACVYVDEKKLDAFKPKYTGWLGVEGNMFEKLREKADPFDKPSDLTEARPSRDASRLELGTFQSILIRGAIESVKFIGRVPAKERYDRVVALRRKTRDGLEAMGEKVVTPTEEENPGSAVTTFASKDHARVVEALKAKKVMVAGRFGNVRVAPHYYNTPEDVDAFLAAYKAVR